MEGDDFRWDWDSRLGGEGEVIPTRTCKAPVAASFHPPQGAIKLEKLLRTVKHMTSV